MVALVLLAGEGYGGPDGLVYIRWGEGLTGSGQHPDHPGQTPHVTQGQEIHSGETSKYLTDEYAYSIPKPISNLSTPRKRYGVPIS